MFVCLLSVQPEIVELGEDPIDRQASGRLAGCHAIAAPFSILGALNHVRASKLQSIFDPALQHDVALGVKEIHILRDSRGAVDWGWY